MYKILDTGTSKNLETWHITIPLHDNDGNAFEKSMIDSILEDITLNFPGFTIVNCTGYWRDASQTYVDENIQLIIDALPSEQRESAAFFSKLKGELVTRLRQEKIYITKAADKQEFLSFDEFFDEIGIEAKGGIDESEKNRLARQIVERFDFVLQRLGYETTALRRDYDKGKLIWERKLCGITLKTEMDDPFPHDVKVIAADRIDDLSKVFATEAYAVVGHYEFQFYAVAKIKHRPLVEVELNDPAIEESIQYYTPAGEPISLKRFIEEFTMSILTNIAVLRDEGFLVSEIRVTVGSDGSVQVGDGETGTQLFICPANISDHPVQLEIIRCVHIAGDLLENNELDEIAMQQAKAKNNYILKRAIMRRFLKGKQTK